MLMRIGPGRCGANISEKMDICTRGKKVRDTLGILMMSCVVPPRGGLVIQEGTYTKFFGFKGDADFMNSCEENGAKGEVTSYCR